MNYSLLLFYQGTIWELFLLLFAENLILALLAVFMGALLLKTQGKNVEIPDKRERRFFFITILVNTVITYIGFLFWSTGTIQIRFSFDFSVLTDFIFAVLVMDLLTWSFHFILHRKPFFENVHYISHSSTNLSPASLFVIHPVESLMLGSIWLAFLSFFTLNIFSIILFLVFHVILGIIANLGIIIQAPDSNFLRLFISPAFRLEHHKSRSINFGFYTKVWDNLFKTLSAHRTNFAKDTL
jgi:Delta7-sterol 5-desaturase